MATRRGQTSRDSEARETGQQAADGAGEQGIDQGSMENLQQQLGDAMQPVIANMQEQLSKTVRNLAEQSGAGGQQGESEGSSDESGGSVTDSAQSIWQSIAQTLQNIWQWIVEMVKRLGDQVAEAIGNFVGLLVQRAIKSAF